MCNKNSDFSTTTSTRPKYNLIWKFISNLTDVTTLFLNIKNVELYMFGAAILLSDMPTAAANPIN